MNFITRNLGWILLLLFFVFMLFVISTNSPEKKDIRSFMSGTKVTSSGEELGELDKLMEKIDAEEDEATKDKKKVGHNHNHDDDSHEHGEENHDDEHKLSFVSSKETKRGLWNRLFGKKDSAVIETENTSATGELAVVKENEQDIYISKDEEMKLSNEKRGLFSRLFSKKENNPKNTENKDDTHSETKDTEEETNTDINTEKTKQAVQASSENTSSKKDLIIKKSSSKTVTSNSQNINLVKNTKNARAHSTVKNTYKLPSNFIFPGKNLTTKVGKSYEIGVKSLKLNNKGFTRNLGYMMKGDTVKQLAPANARGCFLAEVTKATISTNQGKKGYVCKKWLSEVKSKDIKVSEPTNIHIAPSMQHGLKVDSALLNGYTGTKIGDQVKVSQTYITDKKVVLEAKNTLEQVTQKDPNGCMKFLITESNIINIAGKAITICQ